MMCTYVHACDDATFSQFKQHPSLPPPTPPGRCVKLVEHFEHKYDYITNEGRTFFFRTNRDGAAKYKVVRVTLPPAGDAAEAEAAALAKLPFEVRGWGGSRGDTGRLVVTGGGAGRRRHVWDGGGDLRRESGVGVCVCL